MNNNAFNKVEHIIFFDVRQSKTNLHTEALLKEIAKGTSKIKKMDIFTSTLEIVDAKLIGRALRNLHEVIIGDFNITPGILSNILKEIDAESSQLKFLNISNLRTRIVDQVDQELAARVKRKIGPFYW